MSNDPATASSPIDQLVAAAAAAKREEEQRLANALEAEVARLHEQMHQELSRALKREVVALFTPQLRYVPSGKISEPVERYYYRLWPKDPPPYAAGVGFELERLAGTGTADGFRVRRCFRNGSNDFSWGGGVYSTQTAEDQMAVLGAIVAHMLEGARKDAEEKAAKNAREAEWAAARAEEVRRQAALEAAALAELAGRVAAVRRGLEAERDAFIATNSWPAGQLLVVWRVEWAAAVDDDGSLCWEIFYTLTSEPNHHGTFQVIEAGGLQTVRLNAPNGYRATAETWRSLADVPRIGLIPTKRFGETVHVSRRPDPQVHPFECREFVGLENVEHPGPVLRQLLGMDEDESS